MSVISMVGKLYRAINGCPIVFVIFCSFVIHTLCSSHPALTLYWIYIYIFTSIRKTYSMAKRSIMKSQSECEDLELQIEILKTKLCVAEAELQERLVPFHRASDNLQKARKRVLDLIAADESLHRLMLSAEINGTQASSTVDEQTLSMINKEFSSDLLNGLMESDKSYEKFPDSMECGESIENDSSARAKHYSTIEDDEGLQDCRIKIVKVTNVYKVAYLKHFIKQKRQRRAAKRALLKKKTESIRLLLEDWQKALNMVTNIKYSIMNLETQSVEVASQEAMGDYTKPSESSDSDSDIRNEIFNEEYCRGKFENAVTRDYDHCMNLMYSYKHPCVCFLSQPPTMRSIAEETGSQLAIEELSDESDCRDTVAI